MSVYEKINEAIKKTDMFIKEGKALQDAIKEATTGLNLETSRRVVEQYNVNKFLDLLKSGEDRSTTFELADPYLLNDKKQSDDLEKKSYTISNDFYFNKKKEKQSSLKSLDKRQEPLYKAKQQKLFSTFWVQSDFLEKIAKDRNILKEATIERAKMDIKHHLKKIAKYATKKDMSEIYCAVKNDPIGRLVLSKIVPKNVSLEKVGFIEDKQGIVDDFLACVDNYKKLALLEKKAAPGKKPGGGKKPSGGKKPGDGKKDQEKTQKSWFKKWVSKPFDYVTKPISKSVEAIQKTPAMLGHWIDVKDVIGGASQAEILKDEFDRVEDKSNKFVNALKYKEIYEDLANFDKEITKLSPKLTSSLYQSLIRIAPSAMTNKEVVRSYLKSLGSMAEPTISVFDADQLRKLEERLKGNKVRD